MNFAPLWDMLFPNIFSGTPVPQSTPPFITPDHTQGTPPPPPSAYGSLGAGGTQGPSNTYGSLGMVGKEAPPWWLDILIYGGLALMIAIGLFSLVSKQAEQSTAVQTAVKDAPKAAEAAAVL